MLDETTFQQGLLDQLCEHAPVGMALVSLDGRWMKVNPALCRFLGYKEIELIGTAYQRTEPEEEDLQKLLSGEIRSFQLEKAYPHQSGETVWGLLTGSLFEDSEGHPLFIIFHILDITERKKEQQKKREIEDLFRLISQNSQDMICFGSPDGTCHYVSPAVRSMLGYDPVEIIGPKGMDLLLPRDAGEDRLTYQLRHKDGFDIWCETTITKLLDEEGKVYLIVAVARDITYRKRMEIQLQETEQRHKSLIRYTPVAICSLNREGEFMTANPACLQIAGYSVEELSGMNFRSILSPEDIPWLEKLFYDAFSQEVKDVEFTIFHKDGRRIDLLSASSPIIVNGETIGIYIIAKDITDAKQTEELLRRSEKLSVVGELAAGVAHEIRNPLMSLRGFVQLLQREDPNKGHREYFSIMLSEVDRINRIVSELLLLAKPEKRKYEYMDLSKKLQRVTTLFQAEANLRNIQIRTILDPRLPLIYCEGDKIKQVFVNILKNALEAMPHTGEITVQTISAGQEVWIRIRDEGTGIPQDALERISQPFYTTKDTGTGLGLVVCQRIIANHQGRMHIESEEGKGTMVEIVLPSQYQAEKRP